MKKGLKKFVIVCGVVAGIGALCTVAGFAMGGAKSIDKVSDKYSWFNAGTEHMKSWEDDSEITGIKIDGDYDVRIQKGERDSVKVCYAENLNPDIFNDEGRLSIVEPEADSAISIDFSSKDTAPYVEITCADGKALNVVDVDVENGDVSVTGINAGIMNIDSEFGQIALDGVKFDRGEIDSESGDIVCTGVVSRGVEIDSECGDCTLSGTFAGKTDVEIESGNLQIDTDLAPELYSVKASAESGAMKIGKTSLDYYDGVFADSYGPNKLMMHSECGDITVKFGSKDSTADIKAVVAGNQAAQVLKYYESMYDADYNDSHDDDHDNDHDDDHYEHEFD